MRAVSGLTTVSTLEFLGAFTCSQVLDLPHFKAGDCSSDYDRAVSAARPILPEGRNLVISSNPWSIIAAANVIILPALRSVAVKVAKGLHVGDGDSMEGCIRPHH